MSNFLIEPLFAIESATATIRDHGNAALQTISSNLGLEIAEAIKSET